MSTGFGSVITAGTIGASSESVEGAVTSASSSSSSSPKHHHPSSNILPNKRKSASFASSSPSSRSGRANNKMKESAPVPFDQEEEEDHITFDPPLGRNALLARQALLQASDDALGVHRRTYIRRVTMVLNIVIFLALAGVIAFLAQQITAISDLVSGQLADVSVIRSTADGKPVTAGSVVSFSAGGVLQGHGPYVATAMSSLPCHDAASRIFFRGNSSIVSASVTSTNLLAFWSVDTSLNHQIVSNMTVNTTVEDVSAAPHVLLAGIGTEPSSSSSSGSGAAPYLILAGAASGSSSVFVHVIEDSSTSQSKVLTSFFAATVDRSSAFMAAFPSSSNVDGVLVGYTCADKQCCIDAISWAGDVLFTGPRLSIDRCPKHATFFNDTYLVLPTLPVVVVEVNTTVAGSPSMKLGQILRLPFSFASVGNSSEADVRVVDIPPPHSKQSILVAVSLHNMMLLYQVKVTADSSSSSSSSSSSYVLTPQLYATIRTGLAGPISLTGLVFSSTQSWASLFFRDANLLQFSVQVSFVAASGETSPPALLPSIGASPVEYLWQSDAWRHTMLVARETPKYCGLRSFEWQGGLNFAGIAGATAASGQAVNVFTGGIARVFAGLVPGVSYGVGANGTVVPMHDPLSVAASADRAIGRALSTTEMYIFPTK